MKYQEKERDTTKTEWNTQKANETMLGFAGNHLCSACLWLPKDSAWALWAGKCFRKDYDLKLLVIEYPDRRTSWKLQRLKKNPRPGAY